VTDEPKSPKKPRPNSISHAFKRKHEPELSKTEMQDLLRQAVENTRLRQEASPGAAAGEPE
jgi:hypothetical protein